MSFKFFTLIDPSMFEFVMINTVITLNQFLSIKNGNHDYELKRRKNLNISKYIQNVS